MYGWYEKRIGLVFIEKFSTFDLTYILIIIAFKQIKHIPIYYILTYKLRIKYKLLVKYE